MMQNRAKFRVPHSTQYVVNTKITWNYPSQKLCDCDSQFVNLALPWVYLSNPKAA